MVKILFISDTHFGYDFELAYNTVKKILDMTKPDLILSGGDWDFDTELISKHGTDWFKELFSKYKIYSVIGNHDLENGDTDTIKQVLNIKNSDGSRVFFDGLITVNGVKILGVPGLIGNTQKVHNTDKLMGDITDFEKMKMTLIKHRNSEPDFLIMHDCPDWYLINMVNYIVNTVKPKNILCGHIHDEAFRIKQIDYYLKSNDPLCKDNYVKKRVNIIKVITKPPFTGYAVINYNPDSREIISLTLGRLV